MEDDIDVNGMIWLAHVRAGFQEVLEAAMEAEHFDVPTLFHRIVTHKDLSRLDFVRLMDIKNVPGTRGAHDEGKKVAEALAAIERSFTVDDLRVSNANRPEYIKAPLLYYFWLYLFWAALGPEEVCKSETVREMLNCMMSEYKEAGTETFETRVRMDDTEERQALIPYLLFEMDRFVTTWRYEKANTRDGKAQSRLYLQ